MQDTTVILSVYKRPYAFEAQYNAIKNQTHKSNIWIWINKADGINIPADIFRYDNVVYSSINFGVWGRFSLALNVPTKYTCIIDDDTIPEKRWIENCIKTIDQYNGVITTRGVIAQYGKDHLYPNPESYEAVGWGNPNEDTVAVDMGCHCWFFETEILSEFWRYAPKSLPMNFGEDMHLSFIAQKLGLRTFVAPHPINDTDLWGSNPITGHELGSDKNAISWNPQANYGMNQYWNHIRKAGYKIIQET